jgi:hypothetical protein
MITLSLEEAQKSLQNLAQRALQGEAVYIRVAGAEGFLSLQSVPTDLPPNYLAQCYGPEEITEEDHLASFAPKGVAT